jgi:hypothetical protein
MPPSPWRSSGLSGLGTRLSQLARSARLSLLVVALATSAEAGVREAGCAGLARFLT